MSKSYDLIVVGAGLVGLATAYQYLLSKNSSGVLVLEKEAEICQHQSGRNSGVIHSGIYYKPGSLKAENCRRGKKLLEDFCAEHSLPWKTCGKVIVATSETEKESLSNIYQRGLANQVPVKLISSEELKEIEPYVNAKYAMHVPDTGVVDFKAVAEKLAELIKMRGGEIICNAKVEKIDNTTDKVKVYTTHAEYQADQLVNCAGLYSDKIMTLCGEDAEVQIVPFRGEYYLLDQESERLCNNLIYPVPDPQFPFLGVHFTRSIHGEVDCGPNAVLAFAREGYRLGTVNLGELSEALLYRGLQKLVLKHWKYALREMMQSFSKKLFVRAAQKLVPEIQEKNLTVAPAGVRAQAIDKNGKPVDDFLVRKTKNSVHVLNAPSPAATSCLSIGSTIVKDYLT